MPETITIELTEQQVEILKQTLKEVVRINDEGQPSGLRVLHNALLINILNIINEAKLKK